MPFANCAKYLGVLSDSKLNYKLNILERASKATLALYACKQAIGRIWGLKPYVIHWLYTAVVRPIMLYEVFVWWRALEKPTYCNILDKVQRIPNISIIGALLFCMYSISSGGIIAMVRKWLWTKRNPVTSVGN